MAQGSFSLTGRVAIVTGASRGLGQTFARAMAEAGADLVITSRDPETLKPFQREIEGLGRKALALALDVRDYEGIQSMAQAAFAHYGKIDILVNNAGCNVRKPALDVTWDDWNLVLDTNLRGAFFVAQAVARHMTAQKYGRIINIGSVTCVAGYAGLGPYGASRGGIKQLTMSLADDWGINGILSRAGLVQNRPEFRDVRRPGVGEIPMGSDPAEAPRPTAGSRRRGGLSRVRRQRVHHRPDVAGGWRHFDGGDPGAACEEKGWMT